MNAGKDVMLDKPGCTNLEQLQEKKSTTDKTKQILQPYIDKGYITLIEWNNEKLLKIVSRSPFKS